MAAEEEGVYRFKGKHLAIFVALDLILFVLVFVAGVRIGQNLGRGSAPAAGLPGPEVRMKVAARSVAEAPPSKAVRPPETTEPALKPAPGKKTEIGRVEPQPKEAPRTVAPAAPPPKAAPPKAPEVKPPPKEEAPARFTLQVSSHKGEAIAQQISEELKKAGFPAYVVRADLKEKGIWYRVRVGRYPLQADAQAAAQELQKKTGQKGLVAPL